MAYKNKSITNPKTGQAIIFLQTAKDTGGKLLEMESTFRAHSKEPPPHYHPKQEESFSIVSGTLTVRLNGELKAFSAGDKFHVPRKMVHAMWNESDSPAVVRWQVSPALNTENFFETTIGLANAEKTNEEGMPGILQVALLANKFDNIFRLSRPPFIIQKIIFSVLTPVAYLAGYRPTYDEYLN